MNSKTSPDLTCKIVFCACLRYADCGSGSSPRRQVYCHCLIKVCKHVVCMWTWLATHAIAAANQRSCCCSCNHCDSRRGNNFIDSYRLCVTVCWHSRPASRLRGGTASSAGATTKPRRRIVFHQRRPPPTDDSSHLFCLPPTSPDSIPSPTGFDNLGPDTTEDIPDSGMRLLCPPYTGEGTIWIGFVRDETDAAVYGAHPICLWQK